MSTPQSDILKSISEQVGGSASRELPLSWILYPAAIAVALILVFSFLHWQKRRAATRPTALNDPKKLLAELRSQGVLTRAELRQLKLRSRQLNTMSPLTVALCPSLKKLRRPPSPCRIRPMPGEFDFIHWLRGQTPKNDSVLVPPGDDLAVLKWPAGNLLLIGADQVLDQIHFDSRIHSPRAIGRKVMNRNLSDCAAMASIPTAAVATVALPRSATLDYAKELYLGLREAADPFHCPIVGGDTASWPHPLCLTVTILARSPHPPIPRSGARPGDSLYVTGPLGGSILGRHMTFQPRIAMGLQLAPLATSLIDLSDGLSRDLQHLCHQSHVGVILNATSIPIHPDAITLSNRDNLPPLHHALHDGEDHELLFTTSQTPPPGCTLIGQITSDPQILLRHPDNTLTPLAPQAWEHPLG